MKLELNNSFSSFINRKGLYTLSDHAILNQDMTFTKQNAKEYGSQGGKKTHKIYQKPYMAMIGAKGGKKGKGKPKPKVIHSEQLQKENEHSKI